MTIEESLARWLPAQRWFAGKSRRIRGVEVIADTGLAAGYPALRHLVVSVEQDGGGRDIYQVLAGLRARIPGRLEHAVIGPAGHDRIAYDALHDPELTRLLLGAMARQARTGPVRFATEPGAQFETGLDSIVLTSEQSNTSLIFGEASILKVFRRLSPGPNPDLEVPRALAGLGSPHVARPLGWIERQDTGGTTVLAILSEYLRAASDGWSLAATSVRDLYAGEGTAANAGGDFSPEAGRLGEATAEVHRDLARAFGSEVLPSGAAAELAGQMTQRLEAALAAVPELAPLAGSLRAAFADLAKEDPPLAVQRVHGDYHLGQVMRTQTGWVVLDFEGEPAVPLDHRRALSPALRDVAGMLRSFEYAARHQLPAYAGTERVQRAAREWVRRNQAAFCAGYAEAGGMDPAGHAILLRALILDKAVYEVVYEAGNRPSWLHIPLDSLAAA